MTGKTDGQTEVDFALTSDSVDAAMRVIQQLNTLNQFLDLLRMRLAIQQDFTLGSLVSQFDHDKKGFVTIDDFRPQASLEAQIEDLHYLFTQQKSPKISAASPTFATSENDLTLSYQSFVKLFMPVGDKRFITLVIQRSEKAKQSSDPADQSMTPETLSLAC